MTMYGRPSGADAVVEDVHGVLRLELGRGARLDLEAGARLRLLGELRLDELDGDARAERGVHALPHGAHAAGADEPEHAVLAADDRACERGRVAHGSRVGHGRAPRKRSDPAAVDGPRPVAATGLDSGEDASRACPPMPVWSALSRPGRVGAAACDESSSDAGDTAVEPQRRSARAARSRRRSGAAARARHHRRPVERSRSAPSAWPRASRPGRQGRRALRRAARRSRARRSTSWRCATRSRRRSWPSSLRCASAKATGANVKTEARDGTTQALPLSFTTSVADCTVVALDRQGRRHRRVARRRGDGQARHQAGSRVRT